MRYEELLCSYHVSFVIFFLFTFSTIKFKLLFRRRSIRLKVALLRMSFQYTCVDPNSCCYGCSDPPEGWGEGGVPLEEVKWEQNSVCSDKH